MLAAMTASDLIRRAGAATLGLTDSDLRRQTTARELLRIRRGSYVDNADFAALEAAQRHAAAISAAYADQDRLRAVTFQSAAVCHGLPTWGIDLSRVHLTKSRRNSGRVAADLHVHANHIEDDEIIEIEGALVTTAARTVFDVTCVVPFEQGVVVADAALHAGSDDGSATRRHHRPVAEAPRPEPRATGGGIRRRAQRECRRIAEPSRHARHGIPAPELQHPVYDVDGTLLGTSDFRWGRLLGEFDGMVKYGRLLRPGETAGDCVTREKVREDRMRARDHGMFRWIWVDLATTALWRRMAQAIDQFA